MILILFPVTIEVEFHKILVISKLPQQSKYEFLSRIKSLFTQKLIGVSFYSDNSSYLRILKYICWVFVVLT